MIDKNIFIISNTATVTEGLQKLDILSISNSLTLFVIDGKEQMCGTITDGDIRRGLIKGITLDTCVEKIMNSDFSYLKVGEFDIIKYKEIKKRGLKLVPILDKNYHIVDIYNFNKVKSYLPLDAVLMAGGKGERLRPLTEKTPKPLLKVADKCIIDYNVDNLINHGIKHIYTTINYLGEQLEEHFSEPIQGTKIKCIKETRFLGTIGSVKLIENLHNETILVMNSDLFTNIDLEDFYFHFMEHQADMSIVAIPYTVNIPYAVFELEGRYIQALKEKPTYHYYANAGIYMVKKSLLNLIPEETVFHATDLIELLVRMNKKVIRYPHSGYWIDIGKPEDFKKVQDFAKHIN